MFFLLQDIELRGAWTPHIFFSTILPVCWLQNTTANRDPICDIPRVRDMIQDDSTVHLAMCSIQHPREWDLSEYV